METRIRRSEIERGKVVTCLDLDKRRELKAMIFSSSFFFSGGRTTLGMFGSVFYDYWNPHLS
jgi:hypothetical protein